MSALLIPSLSPDKKINWTNPVPVGRTEPVADDASVQIPTFYGLATLTGKECMFKKSPSNFF